MRIIRNYTLLSIICLMSACTSIPDRCVQLPRAKGHYCLQPSTAAAAFSAQQKVELNYQQLHETMIADLEVNSHGLQFTTFTPFGQKILQVHDDNLTISNQSIAASSLDSTLLVGLLQLALWPSDSIKAGLKLPLTMTETAQERMIFSEDKKVLSIQYADKSAPYHALSIQMPLLAFSLDIHELPESTPPND